MTLNKTNSDNESDDEDANRSKTAIVRMGRSNNIQTSSAKDENAIKPYTRRRDDSCASRTSACQNGSNCFNARCPFLHPSGWNVCKDGANCEDFSCHGNHPFGRTKPCPQGEKCYDTECKCLHPSIRMPECKAGDQCHEWNCKASHSENRPKPCFYEQQCYDTACLRLHPPNRNLCTMGAECVKFACSLNHPPGRLAQCEHHNTCGNYYCMFLHSDEWDPCETGSKCLNSACPHTSHPSDRKLQCRNSLKSVEQRRIDRQKAKLPILASKDEFCQRLKEKRILIVSAETGSGKSTQLPQYAAEYFNGLVVCTQPRVVAAISLARRVAIEYDGTSVGESVGYQVGYGGIGREHNRVPGTDIMFMTDSTLIQESQTDRQLSKIKVLIIDEAHERSLNTDIVIGIAKRLLELRSTDFYVVIASATIDPAQFLTFFGKTNEHVLNVPGRIYDVSVEYSPKPDESIEDFDVSTVFKFYKDRPQGHILVFLPGQREIEKAIDVFNRDIPDNCIALPLYGSLSPEEQDRVLQFDEGPNGERRMVVFCTNVAETSLTIKNIRLVIDSGWVKEALFDPNRRLTIIETVRISKSSANQRKGRAGRTAPGHCVRLYNENELRRTNIEPEIRRSSLDLVVLQLLHLQLNPLEFPFMDPPENSILQKSLQLLEDLSCIDQNHVITSRGELFAELAFDPRLSAVMVDTYIEHSPMLEITTLIVAILTAPGTLFFMGGITKEEKQATRGRIAMGAQEHDSDLFYLASIFKKWQSEGAIDPITRTCLTCKTINKRDKSCRSCRVAYTVKHILNNKILNIIEVNRDTAMKIITNNRWQLKSKCLKQVNESDIIGAYLLKNFPEHHGHLLVSHLPNEGVCMITNNLRARITSTSVFVQRRVGHTQFIAMFITKLSTGDYVIERLHPLSSNRNIHSKVYEKLSFISNVGWEWNFEIRKQIKNLPVEPWNAWLVYEYDMQQCKLIIWGEMKSKDQLHKMISPLVKNKLDLLFACTRSFDCGPTRASFESGLVCSHIENLHHNGSAKNRIDLQHIQCKNFEELDEWLSSSLNVHLKDIRENNFRPCKKTDSSDDNYEAPPFFLVFKSEEVFKKALAQLPSFNVCAQRLDATDILHMNEKDSWGRQLLLTSKSNQFFNEEDIKAKIGHQLVSCKQLGKKLLPGLQLSNMPANVEEAYIRNLLGSNLICVHIKIFNSDANNPEIGSKTVRVCFNNEEQCAEAQQRLQSGTFTKPHSIKIFSKHSKQYKNIIVQPSVEKLKIDPPKFLCTAKSRRLALEIYSECRSFTVDSSSYVTVSHLDLYPMFNELLENVRGRFHVQIQQHALPSRKDESDAVRCILTGASPPKTAMAASILRQAISPIIIKLADDRQKCLFNELFNEGLIQTWTNELTLSCEKKDKFGTVIEIYGLQIGQGQLMRRIADYSDVFDKRYRILDLNAEVISYFGRHKAADMKLQEINSKWAAEGCTVTFIRRTSSILLYVQPKVSLEKINMCENELRQLLNNLAITDLDDDNTVGQQEFARKCAFCLNTMATTRTFRICGHAYCRCAISMLNKIPMKCPTCKFQIHIQDIQEMFSNNRAEFIRLCKGSIQTYLLASTNPEDNDQLFCPNDECDGLILRSQGYQTCLTCGQSVCGMCRLIDDELHEGRTCAEREAQRMRGEFLPQLFQEAEAFIKDSWPSTLPPIIRVDNNKYLNETECVSLRRFYEGAKSIDNKLPPDVTRGFFAFHGTLTNAVEPICKEGFDPTRRRGQVYGPGEYFGVTAAISHGYSKLDDETSSIRMMLITFILRCDRVKTQTGFCYVVNNPVDCSSAFNLPVAVVTYGNDTSKNYPSPFTMLTTSSIKTSLVWISPFRWHWRQDNRNFEPYNDKINNELEQFYEKWKLGNGPAIVTTSPLVRYVDDTPQTYSIDFQKNIQKHTKTNFPRRIERRAMNPTKTALTKKWSFRNESNQWTPYDSFVQAKIENAYNLYQSEQGPSKITVQFPGRPEIYEVDFVAGKQMNKTTNEIRLIAQE
ncbi:unnamed protein product [Adineta steineri]|uniref:Poly [ADP-ribose] polymerase n=1 Tax=Adineta steineri TaxID=433720 RepID=A0A814YCX0_9BILA|nr:unnamed protein product [Adineta steineri]CAF3663741.1 unnamed protein product [Adineta steineri]